MASETSKDSTVSILRVFLPVICLELAQVLSDFINPAVIPLDDQLFFGRFLTPITSNHACKHMDVVSFLKSETIDLGTFAVREGSKVGQL